MLNWMLMFLTLYKYCPTGFHVFLCRFLVVHVSLSFSVVCDLFLVIILYTIFIFCLLAISQSKMICIKKYITSSPCLSSTLYCCQTKLEIWWESGAKGRGVREWGGRWGERARERWWFRLELAVVPFEFYFTEQIIWLTAVPPPPCLPDWGEGCVFVCGGVRVAVLPTSC